MVGLVPTTVITGDKGGFWVEQETRTSVEGGLGQEMVFLLSKISKILPSGVSG